MLDPSRQQQWQRIGEVTRQMLQLFPKQDWQTLIDLSQRRQQMLEAFFAQPVSQADADEIADGIQQILQSDREVMAHARRKQQDMVQSVRQIGDGRQAIDTYQQVDRG